MIKRILLSTVCLVMCLCLIGADGDCDPVVVQIDNATKVSTVTKITSAGQYVEVVNVNDIATWIIDHKIDRKIICITSLNTNGTTDNFIIVSEPYTQAEITNF